MNDIKSDLQNLLKSLEESFKGLKLWCSIGPSGNMIISQIVIPKEDRSKGIGSKVMKALTDFADKNKINISLTPDKSFGGSIERLKRFYRRFGFKPNKDYRYSESMMRKYKEPLKEMRDFINIVVAEETYDGDEFFEAYGWLEYPETLNEAEYRGRKVPLNKPMRGDVKKFKVYTKNQKGNVVKVNFGDPDMKIKKYIPARRRSFRARHHCDDNPGPKWKANYWSCKKW